jgi:hypothetical protein
VVRIPGSHPGGPGSIPGIGNLFLLKLFAVKGINFFMNIVFEEFHAAGES